jgi:hypothetical protein
MLSEVGNCRLKSLDIVIEQAQRRVTVRMKNASILTRHMVMVKMVIFSHRLTADRTLIVLTFQHEK